MGGVQKLTAVKVQKAGPGRHHDGGGTGLFLWVKESGSRQWVQRLTVKGRRVEMGLGAPPVVSLAMAREQAVANARIVHSGGDPLAQKRQAQGVQTFEAVARRVHEMHKPSWKNEKHAAQFIGTLETYAFPKLGQRKITDLTSADVHAALEPVWLTKPETARRVRQRISMVFRYAIAQGWRLDDPSAHVIKALPKQSKAVENRAALPYEEVANAVAVVRASGAHTGTKLAIEFCVLTAGRSGEIRGARWDEVITERDGSLTWLVPAERMKMKREHRVPLSTTAVGILEQAKELRDASGLVFPSARGLELSDNTLSKLLRELGIPAVVHGFRTSFRTWAQEKSNAPFEVSEAALAHVNSDKASAAYARSDLFERRRQLMQGWADYLAGSASVVGEA